MQKKDDKAGEKDIRHLGDPGTQAFQVDNYPFYLLNRLVSRYNAIVTIRLRVLKLDVPFWRVLMILGESAPRSIGAISEAAVINMSTMMRIIQRMMDAGLVACSPRPDDNRVMEVRLTRSGEGKLAAARKITSPVYHEAINGFSEKDFVRLTDLIDRLYSNLSHSKTLVEEQHATKRKKTAPKKQ